MSVPVRDLRNNSAALLARVARGESVVVTRDGEAVAAVVPLRRRGLDWRWVRDGEDVHFLVERADACGAGEGEPVAATTCSMRGE